MKFGFIDAKKASYPVALLCQHLGVSRSGYYAWAKRPESQRDKNNRALSVEVAAVHQESTLAGAAHCDGRVGRSAHRYAARSRHPLAP